MSNDPPKQDGVRRNAQKSDGDDQEETPIRGLKAKETDPIHTTPQQDKVDPINLFSSLFSAVFKPRYSTRDKEQVPPGPNISTRQAASLDTATNAILRRVQDEIKQGDNTQEETDESETSKAAEAGPAFKIDDYIPQDRAELRETKLFKSTYEVLQWQRDNYLVGFEYANWMKKHRIKYPDRVMDVPYDKTAFGHQQIAGLLAWFIPTDTVRQALLPIVVDLPDKVLFPIARDATVSLIASQQANLDSIIKTSLISLLKNEQNREAIKNSTQGYISTTYRDSEQESNSNGKDNDV
jgi:hypothetical protein